MAVAGRIRRCAVGGKSLSRETILLKHHGHNHDAVEVNSRDCLRWLTSDADPSAILKDDLICCQKDLWWRMLRADKTADLFDETTWQGTNYTPLVDLVHGRIAIHGVHQQRCENHVQMSALVSSTNVIEARRSDRTEGLSYLMRPFNKDAVEEVNKNCSKDSKPIK